MSQQIQVKASDSIAVLDAHGAENRTQLWQRVEGDGIVAQDARFLDLGQQEDLLNTCLAMPGD